MNEPANISIENPVTMREVGIHLGVLARKLEENASVEKSHHLENLASNSVIMKKLDDIQLAFPTRSEFDAFKQESKDAFETKAGTWVEKVLIGTGSIIGVGIIGALLRLILIKHQ